LTDPARLTRDEMAKRFGVEPRTISNYARRGMPATKQGRCYTFDAAACDAWLAAKRDANGQFGSVFAKGPGGKRPGAGRPKGTKAASEPATSAASDAKADTRGIIGEKGNGNVRLAVTSKGMVEMIEGGVTHADLSASGAAFEVVRRISDWEVKSGKLVNADEMRDAMKALCERIRTGMLAIAGELAQQGGELGLDAAGCAKLKTMTLAAVVRRLNAVRKEAWEQ